MFRDRTAWAASMVALALLMPQATRASVELLHIATAGNTFLNTTFLDHPEINAIRMPSSWSPRASTRKAD